MILIVGLGNPGKKYEKTRHNVGFVVLDRLAKELEASFKKSEKFNAEIGEGMMTFPGQKKHVRLLLAKPQTFMNNSGEAVTKLVQFYKLRTEDQVWIVHDDIDIELGTVRVRLSGSSAGQKGIQSIIEKLGTDRFVRFRIGVKPKTGQPKAAEEFVLEKFRPEEKKIIEDQITKTIEMLIHSMDRGITGTSV